MLPYIRGNKIRDTSTESISSEKSSEAEREEEKGKKNMNNSKEERMRIHDKETHGRSEDIDENTSPEKVKAPNLIERAKEEVEALVGAIHPHPKKQHDQQTLEKEASSRKDGKTKTHKQETHGTSADIDEDTPISKVKGPNIFERAKEEIEAIVEAIHPHKKDSDH